ncbi:MAG: MarR family winged helix-turn-helix transcriptional regulator [Christensenellaceae bacterium]|jgi:DNA-binding MarR family transcriptional regulator
MDTNYNNTTVFESTMRLLRATRRHPALEHGRGRHHGHSSERLLQMIKSHSGASASELAALMDIRPSSLTDLLDRLEHHGDIVRTRDEKDGRIMRISLTELGEKRIKAREKEILAAQESFGACFTKEEQETFVALTSKLTACLEEMQQAWHEKHKAQHHARNRKRGERL